jgi:hypothetical protein
VNRRDAERALTIVRSVVQNTRDDLVARNWGLVWMVHAFTNAAAFASIGLLIESRGLSIAWYLVPLVVVAMADAAIMLALTERDQGVKSFVELQIHGIWVTFILFSLAAMAVLYLSGASPRLLAPLMALTSGIGFSMMGVVFYRRFFLVATLFLLVALLAPLLPGVQWLLLAAVWWAAMFVPGLVMHHEKRGRAARGPRARIV